MDDPLLDSPEIAAITLAILKLKAELADKRAEAVAIAARIGAELAKVKALLPHGLWGAWLARVAIRPQGATDRMNLAAARAQNESWFAQIARLGETRAIRAAYASEPFRWTLSPAWTWNGVPAAEMTAKEFDAALDAADPAARRSSPEQKQIDLREAIDDLVRQARTLHDSLPDTVADWNPLVAWLASIGAPCSLPSTATSTADSTLPSTPR